MKTWTLGAGEPMDPTDAADELWAAWSSGPALQSIYGSLTIQAFDERGRKVGAPVRLDHRTTSRSLGNEMVGRSMTGSKPERPPGGGPKIRPTRDLVWKVQRYQRDGRAGS